MITRETTYKKAFEIKRDSLLKKKKQREGLLAAAYAKNQRLIEIDRLLSSMGATLALTALSGDTLKIEELKAKSQALSDEKNAILKENGVDDIVFDCPLCNDTGYINGKICNCVKDIANRIAISELSANMPLEDSKFENFDLNYYSDKGENPRRRMTAILKLRSFYGGDFRLYQNNNLNQNFQICCLQAAYLPKAHL
jgi:DNA replication protein DnaC